jgi:hypothetical protein
MELSEDDVLHILKLIDESKFDYFQLEVGDLKIMVSKGEPIAPTPSPPSVASPTAARPAAARGAQSGHQGNPRRPGPCYGAFTRNFLCRSGARRPTLRRSRRCD